MDICECNKQVQKVPSRLIEEYSFEWSSANILGMYQTKREMYFGSFNGKGLQINSGKHKNGSNHVFVEPLIQSLETELAQLHLVENYIECC